jgi:3D (Asp-Asp-Asp) domain-containing protein
MTTLLKLLLILLLNRSIISTVFDLDNLLKVAETRVEQKEKKKEIKIEKKFVQAIKEESKEESKEQELKEYTPEIKEEPKQESKEEYKGEIYIVSSYDLSEQSCGKSRSSLGFGNTASGFNLSGQTRQSAMTIAADTNRFGLGTRVNVEFVNPTVSHMNGVYTVRDTGGAIYGNKMDLFMGDFGTRFPAQECYDFGVQRAWVKIVN